MSWASAVVLIVLITAIAGVLRARASSSASQRRRDDDQPVRGPSAREKALESEVEQLRERIQVLERIATDPARRTADEIEKLRDER